MGNNKKFLWHATCALLALSAVPAWAEDGEDSDELVSSIDESQPAVLFKVHDIKPLKNRDGKITNCEFNITFFNRSNKNVDNATVNLTWKDEAIGNVIEDEKELAKRKMEMENYNENGGAFAEPVSETEGITPVSLTTSIRIPPLQPYRQVSLKSKLASDRCFLMLNDAEFSLENCSAVDPEQSGMTMQSAGAAACDNLFRFVSARDPEYYREFKKVSFNEEKKIKQNDRKKEEQELTETYDKAVSNLSKATDIMGQIR